MTDVYYPKKFTNEEVAKIENAVEALKEMLPVLSEILRLLIFRRKNRSVYDCMEELWNDALTHEINTMDEAVEELKLLLFHLGISFADTKEMCKSSIRTKQKNKLDDQFDSQYVLMNVTKKAVFIINAKHISEKEVNHLLKCLDCDGMSSLKKIGLKAKHFMLDGKHDHKIDSYVMNELNKEFTPAFIESIKSLQDYEVVQKIEKLVKYIKTNETNMDIDDSMIMSAMNDKEEEEEESDEEEEIPKKKYTFEDSEEEND